MHLLGQTQEGLVRHSFLHEPILREMKGVAMYGDSPLSKISWQETSGN
jgi:hypothetical protein